MGTISSLGIGPLDEALKLLNAELNRLGAARMQLVICGGSALIAIRLVDRATKDVDILALRDENKNLIDPEPLPEPLILAAKNVARNLALADDWLNNGPSRGDGGLFRLGLPAGLDSRLTELPIGDKLTLFIVSRLDQIFFKLYAAVDQSGGRHADDLYALRPTEEELCGAARWSMGHDPSEGYRRSIKAFLKDFGYELLAERI